MCNGNKTIRVWHKQQGTLGTGPYLTLDTSTRSLSSLWGPAVEECDETGSPVTDSSVTMHDAFLCSMALLRVTLVLMNSSVLISCGAWWER